MTTPAPVLASDAQIAQALIKLGELSTQLAVVDTKQDGLAKSLDKVLPDHEVRIRSLEKFKWLFVGGSLVGGGGAGALVAELVKSLH